MAKKGSTKVASPTGTVEPAGQVLSIPLHLIDINQEIAAREGEPDQDKVMRYAENFIERRSNGMPHQVNPAIVRTVDGGDRFEGIDFRHRFEACKAASKASGEEYQLLAIVVPANDEVALVDAIQSNEFREDPNDFDRAASIEKLVALGKTQEECAVIFGLHPSSISQIRAVGRLEKKYRKAIENGDLDRDAAIFIANLGGDDTARNEVFEECLRHKQRFLDLETRMENKRLKAEAQEKVDLAKQAKEEAEEEAKAKADERKALEKDLKDVTTSLSKIKGSSPTAVEELVQAREKEAKLKAEVEALAKAEAAQTKLAEKAKSQVEKAKADQLKVKEATSTKKAVTQEDAKAAAAEKGAKGKKGEPIKVGPRTAKILKIEIKAMAEDRKNQLPESAKALMGKLEAYLDGDITLSVLRTSFEFNCKTDEQLDAAIKAKKNGKR